eukprot:g1781.t1
MQSTDLQASLGFLQAIHLGAKKAKTNKRLCQTLSTAVGRLRPCLEEVDMAEPDHEKQNNHSLRKLVKLGVYMMFISASTGVGLIEIALEKILVTMGRFSSMGYLQSVLEAQACCDNFSDCRDSMITALENLLKSRNQCCSQRWEEDIKRICERLRELQFDDCNHLKLAKTVHNTSRGILDKKIPEKDGQENIRNQLLANLSISPKDMQQEIQGLERELSRARVEKKASEVDELQMIIRALKQSTQDSENERPPRPPVEYLCPISRGIMKDPVVLVETGQTYDRRYIEEWFTRGNKTCPATKLQVTDTSLTPNYALKSLASSWIDVNSGGNEWVDDDSSITFPRSVADSDSFSEKKVEIDLKKTLTTDSKVLSGYQTNIHCEYSRMNIPSVEQVITSSADLTSVLQKDSETCSEIGSRASSAGGKARTESLSSYITSQDQGIKWRNNYQNIESSNPKMKKLCMDKSRTAVASLASARTSGKSSTSDTSSVKRADGALSVATRKDAATKASIVARQLAASHGRARAFAESRNKLKSFNSSSGLSDISKRTKRASFESCGVQDFIKHLQFVRERLPPYARDADEKASMSSKSSNIMAIRQDSLTQHRRMPSIPTGRVTQSGASVCSGVSNTPRANPAAELESDLKLYKEVDELGNCSDDEMEQHPTDEVDEEWIDNADFDAASLTTIGSTAPSKYAQSVMSMRRTSFKRTSGFQTGFMQGATNVMFDEGEDYEDGTGSVADHEEANDLSLPLLAGMLKTEDPYLAASTANDLAVKAQTDQSVLYEIPRTDVVPSLVKLLSLNSDPVRSAAARALGVIGERNAEARVQILNAGAIQKLSVLFKEANENKSEMEQKEEEEEGSLDDVATAMRFALDALSRYKKDAPSVDVSTPMLVELLLSNEEEMQASAILDLQEKMNSVYGDVVLRELATSDILLNLVDTLEHKDEDVQLGAADILSRLIFHDQKTQIELSQSVGIVSKLLRVVKKGGQEFTSCKSAAAQVLRGLAHNNSKIREDCLKRGAVPDFSYLLCAPDPLARETAAWMLGILASHSKDGQDAVLRNDQALYVLEELAHEGLVHEKVAAKFALRSINQEVDDEEDCELSGPIVINSLLHGTANVKVVAAWELCRMASNNQWSQFEIYENGGVTAILTYLRAQPNSDGTQACLATLLKMAGCEAKVAAQICQEGGVPIAVKLLNSYSAIDKKLVIQLLTVLAEKCPFYQEEVMSNGAVPVLVEMLRRDEFVCKAASKALCCLIENDISSISASVAEAAIPTLLDFLRNSESESFSKKAAAQLLAKMGQANYDCHQCIMRYRAMDVVVECLQTENDPEIAMILTQAWKSMPTKGPIQQNRNQIPRMLQVLENSTKQRTTKTPGLVQIGEYSTSARSNDRFNRISSYAETVSSRQMNRRSSFATSRVSLPVVQENIMEERETAERSETASIAMMEAPESSYAPSHECLSARRIFDRTNQESFELPVRAAPAKILEKPREVAEALPRYTRTRDNATWSTTSSNRGPLSVRGNEEDRRSIRGDRTPLSTSAQNTDLKNIVQEFRNTDPYSTNAALEQLRELNSKTPGIGTAMVRGGTIEMMIGQLATRKRK